MFRDFTAFDFFRDRPSIRFPARPLIALILGVTAASAAFGQPAYPPAEAVDIVTRALRRNPGLAAARLEADAQHAWAHHHKALESPELAVDFFQGPAAAFPNPLKRQEEIDYSVAQKIPFPGKLGSMASAEHWRGAAAGKRAEGSGLELRRRVLTTYAALYAVEWELRLLRENRDAMNRLSQSLKTAYASGTGRQSDWLRAEAESAALEAEILKAEAMRAEGRAELAEALGAEGDTPSTLEVRIDSMTPPDFGLAPEALQQNAMQKNPDLAAMQFEIAMADAEITSAKKEALPDFTVRGMYKDMRTTEMGGDPKDYWSLMVGFQAPVTPWSWNGVRQGTRRARLLREKAGRDYETGRRALAAEVETARSALQSASERLRLSRERQIPLAAQMAQSVQSEYRQGRADFGEWIESLRAVRRAREEYHQAASDHLKAWANLEWLTGGNLPDATGEQP